MALAGMTILLGCQKSAVDPFADSADADRVLCAVAGSADFTRSCLVERSKGPDGLRLTVRHPDGGFRRLQVTTDGRGVVAADGAEAAGVTISDKKQIEVNIAGDRYRLPATVKPGGVG
jgi:hypothetical protein